jgi:DNA modification methylase
MKFNYIHNGDVMEGMEMIPDESVNCVITSPPYWQLRDYGYSEQWGLEPTYQGYLEHLWQWMGEVYRVLTKDGTVWVNLGDTYHKGDKWGGQIHQTISNNDNERDFIRHRIPNQGLPDKCLLLIPHRFAIGCIERGWILRNDIIWAKPNGMPESVTDRFSKRHEFIFLFAKSKKYFFDLDSVRETIKPETYERAKRNKNENPGSMIRNGFRNWDKTRQRFLNGIGKNPGDVSDFWAVNTQGNNTNHYASYNTKLIDKPIIAGCPEGGIILDPFCGTGTTLKRAKELRRKYIGIEASKEYHKLAMQSVAQKELF